MQVYPLIYHFLSIVDVPERARQTINFFTSKSKHHIIVHVICMDTVIITCRRVIYYRPHAVKETVKAD